MIKQSLLTSALMLAGLSAHAASSFYMVVPTQGREAAFSKIQVNLHDALLPEATAKSDYVGFDFKSALEVTGDAHFNAKHAKFSATNLPTGFTLSDDGILSGKPTASNGAGSAFQVSAKYKSKTAMQDYNLQVNPMSKAFLGANPPPVTDYSRTPVYVNLLKQARPFGSADKPWDSTGVAVGADGWPVGDFGLVLMTGQRNVVGVDGVYTMVFDGQATVRLQATAGTIQNKTYNPITNRTRLEVVLPLGADQFMVSFTNVGSGLKNIKVVRPGYDVDNHPLFTDAFLNHIKRFGTLRFMDFLRTNQNTVSTWEQRAAPNMPRTNSAKGAPWEDIIALANTTKQDIWINIPVLADDNYVQTLAKLLKDTLNPRAKIYVEYSNELWNFQFTQHGLNRDLAKAEVAANPSSTLAFDGTTDANVWMYRRIAKRGMEISNMFRAEFGDSEMMTRVRPVFATQVVLPFITKMGLNFIEQVYGSPSKYFYGMGVAPYFNLGTQQHVDGLTTSAVLDAMDKSVTDTPKSARYEENIGITKWHGLKLLAYEGGADTFGPGSLASKKAANMDPRMQEICERYMSSWYSAGGDLFMWFTAGAGNWDTQYGTWELTTDLTITDTPKIRCLENVMENGRPPAEGRNKAPGTFESYAVAGNFPPYTQGSKDGVRYVRAGGYQDYVVDAAYDGTYDMILSVGTAPTGNTINVAVNGKPVANAVPLTGPSISTITDQAPIKVPLKEGFNTIRITTNTTVSGYDFRQLTFK